MGFKRFLEENKYYIFPENADAVNKLEAFILNEEDSGQQIPIIVGASGNGKTALTMAAMKWMSVKKDKTAFFVEAIIFSEFIVNFIMEKRKKEHEQDPNKEEYEEKIYTTFSKGYDYLIIENLDLLMEKGMHSTLLEIFRIVGILNRKGCKVIITSIAGIDYVPFMEYCKFCNLKRMVISSMTRETKKNLITKLCVNNMRITEMGKRYIAQNATTINDIKSILTEVEARKNGGMAASEAIQIAINERAKTIIIHG